MRDPELFFQQYPDRVIIDEAQKAPKLFEVLRSVVDQDRSRKGRFVVTGSSSSDLLQSISESLAGRIATIELGTSKANEIFEKPLSQFYRLFSGKLDRNFFNILDDATLTLDHIQRAWLRDGYPEPMVGISGIIGV